MPEFEAAQEWFDSDSHLGTAVDPTGSLFGDDFIAILADVFLIMWFQNSIHTDISRPEVYLGKRIGAIGLDRVC